MRLIDHIGDATGVGVAFNTCTNDLIEDAEEFKGVQRTNDQVVVSVLAVVEMEAPQPVLIEQLRDNLRDVSPLRMMAHIHQHLGLRTQLLCHQQRRAPVRQIGGVETGLEELVLDQEAHPGR